MSAKMLKNYVIAITEGHKSDDAAKVSQWVQHAGGIFSTPDDERVTHLIVSAQAHFRRTSDQEKIITRARKDSTKCLYLMKMAWLKDSLIRQQSKPFDETGQDSDGKTFAWEPKHAGKVQKRLAAQRSTARRMNHNTRIDQTATKPSAVKSELVQERRRKFRFDKSLLIYEHEQAEIGYQPYTNVNGSPSLIAMTRYNEADDIYEQYVLGIYKWCGPSMDGADQGIALTGILLQSLATSRKSRGLRYLRSEASSKVMTETSKLRTATSSWRIVTDALHKFVSDKHREQWNLLQNEFWLEIETGDKITSLTSAITQGSPDPTGLNAYIEKMKTRYLATYGKTWLREIENQASAADVAEGDIEA